jgi:hypothetical protein
MYEIIAIERGDINRTYYDQMMIMIELYVKLGPHRYLFLKSSRFSKFNKRLTKKLVDIIIDRGMTLKYYELPKLSNIIYRYEV